MNAQALLNALAGYDIRVYVDGDDLLVDTPAGALTRDLRAVLAAQKTDLLALLRSGRGGHLRQPANRSRELAVRHGQTTEQSPTQRPHATYRALLAGYAVGPWDLPADWRVEFEERAAIREYEGGQAREHAEAEAFREILQRIWRSQGNAKLDGAKG